MPCLSRLRPAVLVALSALCLCSLAVAGPRGYVVRTRTYRGKQVDQVIVPGRPPAFRMPAVRLPRTMKGAGIVTIDNVPALTWCFGCSATSAAMMFGHYDNVTGYKNMYAGPTNGGVFPMTNAAWPDVLINSETRSQCPLSATRQGVDGRTERGHVDDYWIQYGNSDDDPWITNAWVEHTQGDCTGDYMGTNQSDVANTDGSTTFYYYTDGTALEDFDYYEPTARDGCHGMKLFANSRGYRVVTNYSQYIYGAFGNTDGFTFADYMAEIDAGRPVLIQVDGHTMLGVGYDSSSNLVYLHDTWDWNTHSMTWGGTYAGLQHYGVTVLRLEAPAAPTKPGLAVTPTSPTCLSTLQGVASGSTDANGTTPSYEYQWAKRVASDAISRRSKGRSSGTRTIDWESWGYDSTDGILTGVALARADRWRVRARATDGELTSDWTDPVEVTILNATPTTPATVAIRPASPSSLVNLSALASTCSDGDGDSLTYRYQWSRSTDNGATWSAWQWTTKILDNSLTSPGELWKVRCRAWDGADAGNWCVSTPVQINNSRPLPPTSVTVTPPYPAEDSTLTASAEGGSDPNSEDTLTYEYAWHRSRDAGAHWSAWSWTGPTLSYQVTLTDELWQARARLSDGAAVSGWTLSAVVRVYRNPDEALAVAAVATPTTRGAEFSVRLSQAASVQVSVRTLAGRPVRVLPVQTAPAGVTRLLWDGRGNSGTSVPDGLYLVEVMATTPGGGQARSLTMLALDR